MLRRPPNSTLFLVASTAAILLICYLTAGIWLPTPAFSTTAYSAPSELARDIYNSSLGFEKIFVVSLPSRTDRRDGISLAAALSNIEFEFIDGVDGTTVPDNAIPSGPNQGRFADPSIGSWRGHMNAIQEVVRRNLTSALILEDDLDWDVRLRDQLRDFALSSHALTQPLASTPGSYADETYPRPSDKSPSHVSDLDFGTLPVTTPPKVSPYGDHWDILWPGHCGMRFPFADGRTIPKGRVAQQDYSVPQQQYLWTISDPNDLREQYPNHTRIVHHVQDGICSLAYGVTRKSARQILYELGLKNFNAKYDILLRWFCEGTGEPNRGYHNCLTAQPSLFGIHLASGLKKSNSDISDHGDGYQDEKTEVIRWSVRMNAEALLEGRTDFRDQYPDVN